jgi:type I restriction enzyme R subunit
MRSRRKAIRLIYPSLLLQQPLKSKTIELFGTIRNGQKEAFDLYTMEQAIKEGFIKDVLKNYMSWKRYYKLIKRTEIDDKEYEKKKTVRLLSSYVDLQDHAIEKKAQNND